MVTPIDMKKEIENIRDLLNNPSIKKTFIYQKILEKVHRSDSSELIVIRRVFHDLDDGAITRFYSSYSNWKHWYRKKVFRQ